MIYLWVFLSSVALAFAFTIIVMLLAYKFGFIDQPAEAAERKIHKQAMPLLGGTAVFAAFFIVLFFIRASLLAGNLEARHWLGFFLGAMVLIFGGALDDKYRLRPSRQIIFPVLAALAVILGGVSIERLSNPFGGSLIFNGFTVNFSNSAGIFLSLNLLSSLVVFLWLMGMMYTTKLLDGLDGLVTGLTGIGSAIIFLFTITTRYYQPDIGLAALALAGACLGFLIFNWHPAKIFLGEGGSLFLGFALGVLSIISGGKIAIALLVMGLPVLDTAWTIIRRLAAGKNPFRHSDRKHLHFRLLDFGLSQRQAAFAYYLIALIFGLAGLFLQSRGKVLALALLLAIMLAFVVYASRADQRAKKIK